MDEGFRRSMLILCHDTLLATLCFFCAVALQGGVQLLAPQQELLAFLTLAIMTISAATFYFLGLHRRVWRYTSTADCIAVAKSSTWVIAITCLLLMTNGEALALLPVLPMHWLMLVVGLCTARLIYQYVRIRRPAGERSLALGRQVPVLLYGCGSVASLFLQAQRALPTSEACVVGVVDDTGDQCGRSLTDVPIVGHACDLDRILIDLAVRGLKPERIVVATDAATDDSLRERLDAARVRHGVQIDYFRESLRVDVLPPAAGPDGDTAQLSIGYQRLRRAADISGSILALVVTAPLLVVLACAVLLDVGMPLLFYQSRPGRLMRPFILYKFRTMRAPYDEHGTPLSDAERTSRLGGFLRRTRLDELPQLFNVLIGDMSLIGPRPLLPRDLPQDLAQRTAMRPGITGWAQVNGGHQLSAPDKLALDLWYVRNATPWLDAYIVWRTLNMMLCGERIDHAALARARAELDRHDDVGCGLPPAVAPAAAPMASHGPRPPNILIVNRFFYPDCSATAQLLTDLVASLDREGCAIRVFTGRERYDQPGTLLPARDRFGSAQVHRLRTTHFGRAGLTGRTVDYLSFYVLALCALLRAARRGDILIVKTDPPLISVVGWLVARLRGARLVNWCQDLFPETAAALGVSVARGTTGEVLRGLRNLSLGGTTTNVVLSEGMARRLQGEGVAAERIVIIHNWADGDHVRPLDPAHNPLRHEWGLEGRFVLGYSGNLGRVHDADGLVALMQALEDEPEILTLFIGAGNGYRVLRNIFAERGIANVRFRPYQPRERLSESLTAPDLHLVTLKPACEGLVMPSKLYGILAAGRPIAFIGDPEGDAARLVREHEAGLVAAPADVTKLAAAIRALRADPVRLAYLGAQARRAYDSCFSKPVSLAAWHTCLQSLGVACGTEREVRLATGAAAGRPIAAADDGRWVAAK